MKALFTLFICIFLFSCGSTQIKKDAGPKASDINIEKEILFEIPLEKSQERYFSSYFNKFKQLVPNSVRKLPKQYQSKVNQLSKEFFQNYTKSVKEKEITIAQLPEVYISNFLTDEFKPIINKAAKHYIMGMMDSEMSWTHDGIPVKDKYLYGVTPIREAKKPTVNVLVYAVKQYKLPHDITIEGFVKANFKVEQSVEEEILKLRVYDFDFSVKEPKVFGINRVAYLTFKPDGFKRFLNDIPNYVEYPAFRFDSTYEREISNLRQELKNKVDSYLFDKHEMELNQIREMQATLDIGDDVNCGLVVNLKKSLAQVETKLGLKWMKKERLYPRQMACQFYDGQYIQPTISRATLRL